MIDRLNGDYSHLDRPEVLMGLFHPRREYGSIAKPGNAIDLLIPVESDIVVGGRFHMTEKSAPNVLFFHGNGEIVGDYYELGPLYNHMGMNFSPPDYRGYGRSTGTPTVGTMMRDCHAIFEFTKGWLEGNGYTVTFILIGRSPGSASALKLASHHKDRMDGLVVESVFGHTGPLLAFLGVKTPAIGFRNLEKLRTRDKPTLVIHAEFDRMIPFLDGQALYDACPS